RTCQSAARCSISGQTAGIGCVRLSIKKAFCKRRAGGEAALSASFLSSANPSGLKQNSSKYGADPGNLFRQRPYISSSGRNQAQKFKTRGRSNAGSGRSSVRPAAVQES